MALADSLSSPQRRINPHRGLVIDVPRWAEAHDYHRIQLARHGLVMHSPGIVSGLDVMADRPTSSSVVVHPGAALDQEGRLIIVPEPHRLDLSLNGAGVAHLAVQYREVPDSPTNQSGDEWAHSLYALEVYSITGGRAAPEGPHLELARVQTSGAGAAFSNAGDHRIPLIDEIDLRYRNVSGPSPSGGITIGVVSLDAQSGADPHHLAGAVDLVHAINCSTRYRGQFAGLIDLTEDVGDCDLLLLSGRQPLSLSSDTRAILHDCLERGTLVFVGFCGDAADNEAQEALAFRQSFEALAGELGTHLLPIERHHPLLAACHRFSAPPRGIGGSGQVLVGGGMAYGEGDYGCLWSGGRHDAPASREAIRSATEFGVNLAVYAANSAYAHSLGMAPG